VCVLKRTCSAGKHAHRSQADPGDLVTEALRQEHACSGGLR